MNEYIKRNLVAWDQLWQARLGKGIPGETISARAGKARKRGRRWGCILCGLLDKIQMNHCNKAMINDIKRAQAVIDDLKDYIE